MLSSVWRRVAEAALLASASRERRRSSSRRFATDFRRLSRLDRFSSGKPIVTMVAKVIIATNAVNRLSGLVRVWARSMSMAAASEPEVDHAAHDENAQRHPEQTAQHHQLAAWVVEHRMHVVRGGD